MPGQVIDIPATHLAGCRRQRPVDTANGRLLYLLCSGAVVVPYRLRGHAWRCVVVAGGATPAGRHITVGTDAIETALPVPMVDPLAGVDTLSFTTVWLTRVWHRWPVGQLPALAGHLASQLLEPGRVVDLTPATVRRLVGGRHLPTGALRHAIARLVEAGLLTETRPARGDDWGRYALTLPLGPVDGIDAVRCPPQATTADSGRT